MISTRLIVALVLCGVSAPAAPRNLEFASCTSQLPPLSTPVLVVDARSFPDTAASGYFVRTSEHRTALAAVLVDCPKVDLGVANTFLDRVAKSATSNARLLISADATIRIYVMHQGANMTMSVEEKRRDSAIVSDFRNLLELIKQARAAQAPAAGSDISVFQADYTLREPRANVTFFAVTPSDGDEQQKQQLASATTGSPEHFRLSADLPVNTVKELDYDTSTGTPQMKSVPKEFLAGFGWYWGDVLENFDYRSPAGWTNGEAFRRLGIKALARFSKEPLDTVGVVGAFRADTFTIFAGPIWTRQGELTGKAPDGKDVIEERYKMRYRVGIGFDLKQAMQWLTPEKKE